LISENQEIPDGARLLLQIDSLPDSVEPPELTALLKYMVKLDCEFKITEAALKKLVSLAESCQQKEDDMNLQEFALIFSRALLQGFKSNTFVVKIIEKAINLKRIDLNIVQVYGKLIQSKKTQRLPKTLDSLIEFLLKKECEGEEDLINLEIFSCVANAAVLDNFWDHGISVMEKNLNNPNMKIRVKCFQGLQARKNKGHQSEIFGAYCSELLEKLKAHTKIQAALGVDLLETLTSVKYWDLEKLKQTSQEHWIRELLLFDLLTRQKANEFEK